MPRKKILIIDDHKEFRTMLKSFIQSTIKDVEIKEAPSGEEGFRVALREKPKIILIDIYLPHMNGVQTAGRIKKYLPQSRIVTMSMYKGKHAAQEFVNADIVTFIDKSEIDHKFISLVEHLLNENVFKV